MFFNLLFDMMGGAVWITGNIIGFTYNIGTLNTFSHNQLGELFFAKD
jgi:hypothetical protein